MNKDNKHTPGPWKLVNKRGKRGQRVCRAVIRSGEHEGLGAPEIAWIKGSGEDGALIVAAPDLLAALQSILADCDTASQRRTTADWDFAVTNAIISARNAISKATFTS